MQERVEIASMLLTHVLLSSLLFLLLPIWYFSALILM